MKKSILINTEEVQQYIKDIRKIPVITHERQEEIFKILADKNITKKERQDLHDELVKGNLRFVITIAKGYQNQGMDIMDLISEGNLGLIKALEKFDPSTGLKFISYAVWWVKQSILASLNDNPRTIRLPSNIVQESQKQKRAETTNDIDNLINNNDEYVSLNLPTCVGLYDEINEDGDQLIDTIVNNNAESADSICDDADEVKKRVNAMLSVLDSREKTIIEKYFGLKGVESNLEDLGEEFGCTKERIRQLKDRSIQKLRNHSYELLKFLNER